MMEHIITYFIVGLGFTIGLRVCTGEKQSLKNWLMVIILWPIGALILILVFLENIEL